MHKKRLLAIMMAVTVLSSTIFTGAPSVGVSAATTKLEVNLNNEAEKFTWEPIAFGQSVDLNFSSTIAPEKVGTQEAQETTIDVIKEDGSMVKKEAVVLESRGGKIANTHDGLTFYNVKVPTSKNFKLTAKVYVNQLGPEESINKAPSLQEGAGLMVRDVNGPGRKSPLESGFEELPAASNIVATHVMAAAKSLNAGYLVRSLSRNGVTQPWGNTGIESVNFKTPILSNLTGTSHICTTEKSEYKEEDFFTLGLERVDDGFIVSYADADGQNYKEEKISGANRVAIIDKENMYVGLYASRNAKVTYTDITLTTSDANTVNEEFVAAKESVNFVLNSSKTSNSSDYTFRTLQNFDGTITMEQDGTIVASDVKATEGEFFEHNLTLTNPTTNIKATLTYDDGKTKVLEVNVVKDEKFAKQDIYVSPNGQATNSGSVESPVDLATAVKYLSEGYTIYMLEGKYSAINITEELSGSLDAKKAIRAAKGAEVIVTQGSKLEGSNWYIEGIVFDNNMQGVNGLRVSGNNNIIENCVFRNNGETGFQMSTKYGTIRSLWPSNNLIKNCDSYGNRDSSGINADGFAAKLGVGAGNVFYGCTSHNNADDGWDFYNKIDGTANEPIRIENCIAYENGIVEGYEIPAEGSLGNGFKLGGEGIAVEHEVINSIAYNNNMDGFTCNFNPGVIKVTNCTSFNNARYNYIFRSSPYVNPENQGIFTNNISYRTEEGHDIADYLSGVTVNSFFFYSGNSVKASDFVSITIPEAVERDENNEIIYGDFLRLDANSKLVSAGSNGTYVGALAPVEVASVVMNKTTATITEGGKISLTATVTPGNVNDKVVTWSSNKKEVATVDQNGVVTAGKAGTAVITATIANGATATCTITVKAKPVVEVVQTPSQVKNIKVTSTTYNSVSLSWEKAKHATAYEVYGYNTLTKKYVLVAKVSNNSAKITKIANKNLQEATAYKFYIKSVNKGATKTVYGKPSSVITASTAILKPDKITNVKAAAQSKTSIKLTWSKSKNATEYKVYGYNAATKKYVVVATVKGTNTTISKIAGKSLKAGTSYKFYVQPIRKVNGKTAVGPNSAVVTKATKINKVTWKSAKSGSKKATLSWKKESTATGYEVFMYNTKTGSYEKIKTITKNSTVKYTKTKLKKGKTYKFKVRAYRTVKGEKVYGDYTSVKSVKVK